MTRTVYLAGPDVFYPDAIGIGARKKEVCARYGLKGIFPLDNEFDLGGPDPVAIARDIFKANCEIMDRADLVIANLSPFRGPGADGGTAFELGYMFALGKPVFGYSNVPGTYLERLRALGEAVSASPHLDRDGLMVEEFGLPDNLMLAAALIERGTSLLTPADGQTLPREDLSLFEVCVGQAAQIG